MRTAMKKIKIAGYARSVIDGQLEVFKDRGGYGIDPGSREYVELAILSGYADGEHLTIPDDPIMRKALSDVLVRLSNHEDALASEEFHDPDDKRMARAASMGLSTLSDKLQV